MEKIQIISDEKPHKCPECRRTFCSMNAMKRHRQAKHAALQDSYMCVLCEARFKTKWSLSTHKSKYHRGQNSSTSATAETAPTGTTNDAPTVVIDNSLMTVVKSLPPKRNAGGSTIMTRIKTRATSSEDP